MEWAGAGVPRERIPTCSFGQDCNNDACVNGESKIERGLPKGEQLSGKEEG